MAEAEEAASSLFNSDEWSRSTAAIHHPHIDIICVGDGAHVHCLRPRHLLGDHHLQRPSNMNGADGGEGGKQTHDDTNSSNYFLPSQTSQIFQTLSSHEGLCIFNEDTMNPVQLLTQFLHLFSWIQTDSGQWTVVFSSTNVQISRKIIYWREGEIQSAWWDNWTTCSLAEHNPAHSHIVLLCCPLLVSVFCHLVV